MPEIPPVHRLGCLDQDVSDIQAEMDDIQRRGLRGIKLHPDFQHFYIDDPKMLPVYEEAHRRGLPVLFHTGDSRTDFSTPRRLMNVIQKIPDFTCIAAHLGGYSEWEDARRELSGTNVYIDTSSSLFAVTPEQARKSIEHFGVDHTMLVQISPCGPPKRSWSAFSPWAMGRRTTGRCFLRTLPGCSAWLNKVDQARFKRPAGRRWHRKPLPQGIGTLGGEDAAPRAQGLFSARPQQV